MCVSEMTTIHCLVSCGFQRASKWLSGWQRGVIERAVLVSVFGVELSVVTPEDLILLKLYAGGLQDRWDIQQLLQVQYVALTDIDRNVLALPERSQALWRELRGHNTVV
jgi:hypothetical protein